MPIYSLLRMNILIGRSYCTAVDISCIVICTEASPAMSMTSESGCAICTPTPARRHPAVRRLEMIVLRRPHLVLPDFSRDVGVAPLGQFIQPLDRILRLDHRRGGLERQRLLRAPAIDPPPPRRHP